MSVLSDIYIARDAEAVKYDSAPDAFSEKAQFRGLTPLELSTLWAIMRGVEWDVAMMSEFICLLQRNGGERLIHSFPSAMVRELARLNASQIRDFSMKWAATDELACAPADIEPVVGEMSRLAQSAASSSRELYLWNCV